MLPKPFTKGHKDFLPKVPAALGSAFRSPSEGRIGTPPSLARPQAGLTGPCSQKNSFSEAFVRLRECGPVEGPLVPNEVLPGLNQCTWLVLS